MFKNNKRNATDIDKEKEKFLFKKEKRDLQTANETAFVAAGETTNKKHFVFELAFDNFKFEKTKYVYFILASLLYSVLFIILSYGINSAVAAVSSHIMLLLFLYSFLVETNVIKPKRKKASTISSVIALILIIPFFTGIIATGEKKDTTDKTNKPAEIQTLEEMGVLGDKLENELKTVMGATIKDFENYVKECEEYGFTVESQKEYSNFSAFTNDGFKITVSYSNTVIRIDLKEPITVTTIDWTLYDIDKYLPLPESTVEKIIKADTECLEVYVGETSKTELEDYVKKCKETGYEITNSSVYDEFELENENNIKSELKYEGFNIMYLKLTKHSNEFTSEPSSTEETPLPSASEIETTTDEYNEVQSTNTDTAVTKESTEVSQDNKKTEQTTIDNSEKVYITPTGSKYHYSKECAGKNAIERSLDSVKNSYGPCKKCAQ